MGERVVVGPALEEQEVGVVLEDQVLLPGDDGALPGDVAVDVGREELVPAAEGAGMDQADAAAGELDGAGDETAGTERDLELGRGRTRRQAGDRQVELVERGEPLSGKPCELPLSPAEPLELAPGLVHPMQELGVVVGTHPGVRLGVLPGAIFMYVVLDQAHGGR